MGPAALSTNQSAADALLGPPQRHRFLNRALVVSASAC